MDGRPGSLTAASEPSSLALPVSCSAKVSVSPASCSSTSCSVAGAPARRACNHLTAALMDSTTAVPTTITAKPMPKLIPYVRESATVDPCAAPPVGLALSLTEP